MERSLQHGGLMQSLRARLALAAALLVLSLAPTSSQAQAAAQLDAPRNTAHAPGLPLRDPGELEVAQRSLVGPTLEVASGLTVLTLTPFVAASVVFATGPGLFPCGLWDDEHQDEYEDQQCEEQAQREADRARAVGAGVGVTMGLLGVALVGHGAYRIHRIRRARRDIRLTGASLAPLAGGATLSVSGSF
jgi:hypothetical protein